MNRRALLATLALCVGCNEPALQRPTADAAVPPAGLSPEQAGRVLATVGDKSITLGDVAATLERMDPFDRLRYQTKERRRELLNELINVELLAAEARRRGLDKDPNVEDAVRIILRDAMLAKARAGVTSPAELTAEELRAYWDAHRADFEEPERRRISAIVLTDRREAAKLLKDAQKVRTAGEWGELFFKHSVTAPKVRGPNEPTELAGDLGFVGPPDDAKGANPRVPESVRAAAFKLAGVGDVAAEVIEADGKLYLVRIAGVAAAHRRTFAEAERSIRVLLVQERVAARDRALEDELRRRFPVQVDDKALAGIPLPKPSEAPPPPASASAGAPHPTP